MAYYDEVDYALATIGQEEYATAQETVGCDFCGASVREPCSDTRSGLAMHRVHPSRLEAAGWSQVGERPDEMPEIRWDRDRD